MRGRLGLLGVALVLAGILLIGAGTVVGRGLGPLGTIGPVAGGPGGMMGGTGSTGFISPGPGQAGFVAGTVARPRVVRVIAGPGYTFNPSAIVVAKGETITFEVTSMGRLVHEFMVGPADAVATDAEGTPEAADIGMMETKAVTYTFDGSGPYAFACHEPGHYEAGMRGIITVVE